MSSEPEKADLAKLRQRGPDFFIVGAPKCGTTALDDYLARHPDIFMGRKECHYFAPDMRQPNSRYQHFANYAAIFAGRRNERFCGESSVYNLYSEVAARLIHDYRPDAKIIIMLRDPVEMITSYHSQLVFNSEEELLDLGDALRAEAARIAAPPARGNRRPAAILYYRRVVSFADQVQRYLDVFGPAQVHVITFDDFKRDTARVYEQTLRFLGADHTFRPSFEVINPAKRSTMPALTGFVRYPPAWLHGTLKHIAPHTVLAGVRHAIIRLFSKREKRPPMNPELRREIACELRPDVDRLSKLLGRDLSMWCQPDEAPARQQGGGG